MPTDRHISPSRNLKARLTALGPLIEHICNTSGIPGFSLGVLHRGQVVHYANFGYRDVAAQIPPDKDTIYVVASLSKAFSSALTGILVDQGHFDWETPIRDLLPEYKRDTKDSACNATVSDLLSHRAGVIGPDGYWLLSDNKVAFSRPDFIKVFNSFPTIYPVRTAFVYNNYAYELIGQIIEKVSGMTFGSFLRQSIMQPLGMSRTFDTRIPSADVKNVAKPYASLRNRTVVELDMPLVRQDGLFSAAGGVRTSVSDLLKFYHALIDAGMSELLPPVGTCPAAILFAENPLRQVANIWTSRISLPFPSLRENSYALGWTRAQLPSTFGLDGPQPWKPVVGADSQCQLALYHQGIIDGFTSFSVLIPETQSAVVALANAGGLNEGGMLIAGAVLDTLLGTDVDFEAYKAFAEVGYQDAASRQARLMKELQDGRKVDGPVRPIMEYVGWYYNALGNYKIAIREHPSKRNALTISFMGDRADTFDLLPYDADEFYWYLDHDDCVSRGRVTEFPVEYYRIRFVFGTGDNTTPHPVLFWEYDEGLHRRGGEPFTWRDIDTDKARLDL